jgi:hypothetical protein
MKKQSNLIKFYPFNHATKTFVPEPKPAVKYVPEWYKVQPGSIRDEETIPMGFATSTIKRCMPIFDAMTAGYILGVPCDIFLDATDPNQLKWSIPSQLHEWQNDVFSYHSPEQYANYPIDPELYHKQLLRIMPMWAIRTPKGYSTLIMNPHHADNSPLWAFSAIVDTDTFATDGHMSFLVKKGFKGVIKQGTPMLQLVPFQRESWEMELETPEEAREMFDNQRLWLRSTFLNGYKNKFRSKKEYK